MPQELVVSGYQTELKQRFEASRVAVKRQRECPFLIYLAYQSFQLFGDQPCSTSTSV